MKQVLSDDPIRVQIIEISLVINDLILLKVTLVTVEDDVLVILQCVRAVLNESCVGIGFERQC